MGSLTTNFKMYKPSPSEFVDANAHLNTQLNLIDKEARLLLEYTTTDVDSITDDPSLEKKVAYKWHKSKSNSQWYVSSVNPASLLQDLYAHVDNWVGTVGMLDSGWKGTPGNELYYSVVSSTGGTKEIRWDGAIVKSDESLIAANTTFVVATGIPTELRPAVSKYFMQDAGNTVSVFSCARVLFNANGNIEIHRYGNDPTGTSENEIHFGGIQYTVEVAA